MWQKLDRGVAPLHETVRARLIQGYQLNSTAKILANWRSCPTPAAEARLDGAYSHLGCDRHPATNHEKTDNRKNVSMSDLTINHFFSTPVYILQDNAHAENLDALLKDIYEWRDKDKVDLVRSNKGGWHSPTDIFRKSEPGLRRVCQLMINCFTRCTKDIAPEFEVEKYAMQGEGWVNINPQYGFNVPHDHPGYTWSGVYYVLLPEKDPEGRSVASSYWTRGRTLRHLRRILRESPRTLALREQ